MPSQQYYVPVAVPVETAPKHPGRLEGIIGVVCAVLAIFPIPPVFGIAGVILGLIAINKGAKTLGIVAIVLSSIFLIIGWFVSIGIYSEFEEGTGFVLPSLLILLR